MGANRVQWGTGRSRRSILAGAAALAGTAGCVEQLQAAGSRTDATQVGFEIKTVPADEDPFATVLARHLAEWFQQAGIDATVLPVTGEELLRQVLFDQDYDAFVAQFPGAVTDPDEFYGLAHSSFAAEAGWQNPFGYASSSTDDALERQRTAEGRARRDAVRTLQERLLADNPFTVLADPDHIVASRDDRYGGLSAANLRDPRAYYAIDRTDPEARTLRVTTTDPRAMGNLNPLNPVYRRDGLVTGLLYEPLAYDGGTVPWLATSVTWADTGDGPRARVRLRENLTWHDGTPLTGADVAFTYRLLSDATQGTTGEVHPPTRFRGRSSPVAAVDTPGERIVDLRFRECSTAVARRALTVPVLPEHVWRQRTHVAGDDAHTAPATATDNVPPIGSGPLTFEAATERERLVLSTFEDHFTATDHGSIHAPFDDGLAFDELVVQLAGSDASAVERVASGEADATVANVGADVVPRIGRNDELDLAVTSPGPSYFVGYNARTRPFSNESFRRLLARLIDREFLASSVFDGYATPALSPLAGTGWLHADFAWDGTAEPVPFIGNDGTLDVDRVRAAFEAAGYRYDEEGRVLEH